MDKMLHRGEYAVKEDTVIVNEVPQKGWKVLGIGKEFTKGDKIIYIAAYVWTFIWVVIFFIGTIMNFTSDIPDSSWLEFWKYFVITNLAASVVIVIWFTIGGIKDLKDMMNRLKTMVRDHGDDGSVREEM